MNFTKMDIKQFKSGFWQQQYNYKSFLPEKINREWIISDASLNNMLSIANIKLGELNAFSQLIPDVDFFIKMHVQKEAIQSSRIEGTRTNLEEALYKPENILPERQNDWLEVNNYVEAMNRTIEDLASIPLSNRLIKKAHSILLKDVRGKNKLPGEYRKSQNGRWYGNGCHRGG